VALFACTYGWNSYVKLHTRVTQRIQTEPASALSHKSLPLWNTKYVQVCNKISHTHTHTLFFKLFHCHLSLARRTACARAQFSGCSSTSNAHSETGQMAVCCQNLTLGALSIDSALSVLVGALFKKFGFFLNMPRIS